MFIQKEQKSVTSLHTHLLQHFLHVFLSTDYSDEDITFFLPPVPENLEKEI